MAAPGVGNQIHRADPDTCGAQRCGEDPNGANQLHQADARCANVPG